jgi:hypothetical protein
VIALSGGLLITGGLVLLAAVVIAGLAALGLGAATMRGATARTHRLHARGAGTGGEAVAVGARWAVGTNPPRLFFTVTYRYSVRGSDYHGTLPCDTTFLGPPGVARILDTERLAGREHPVAAEFEDGTRVARRDELEAYLLARFRRRYPRLEVVFNPNYPVMSMVDPRTLR